MSEYPYKLLGVQPVYSSDSAKIDIERRLLRKECSGWCVSKELGLFRVNTSHIRNGREVKSVAIVAQCQGCGISSGALPHSAFLNADKFPVREREFYERFNEKRQAAYKIIVEKKSLGHSSYEVFLKSSEWQKLKRSVLRREGYVCQCCGGEANTAHHTTYQFGYVPPLVTMWAVCFECHDRLHADKHGKIDPWCVAQRKGQN